MKTFLTVNEEDEDVRIDRYIVTQTEDLSRSYIQKLLDENNILVNGKECRSNYKVKTNDVITLDIPALQVPDILAENIKLDILYEDHDIIVVNKPKGMVVHPAAGHYSGTLVNALLYHCRDELSGINGVLRPGIVHRIDMNTTGVIVACKNDMAHRDISEQLKEHSITRRYRAIVHNIIKEDSGTINAPIGRNPNDRKKMCINHKNGRVAITEYKVLERFRKYTYVECTLQTGRTHQIRVHMASIHHPLLGDDVYGSKNSNLQGQTLHAEVLGFIHPTSRIYMEFEAPLPEYFRHLLDSLPR
ncbi:RluA family pseudouridine synthase [Parasporobacterium paucivorans]|uniref:Pseudouridine synthase n=1 Tax=Parasporobacterium paucivorans DSM 15970 TaxID=1122934 RepID=A0A1M6A3U2_9FIRM|nr:RluA family pseudouridine synthase [Parasporobacterium paucivorans]SHI31162.1 23S rRNA pseudouridine1911/1915/1917 synthase [Parasporobacterium paucivorans DSM 15970]